MKIRQWRLVLVLIVMILFIPSVVFANGWLKNKEGVMVWSASDSLDGESFKWKGAVVNKYVEGKGTLTLYNNGKLIASYEGAMHLGKYHGKGIYVWSDGDRYEGDFVDGIKTGKGTYFFANGNRYAGDYVDDNQTGKGMYVWFNGDRYEGDFIEGRMEGKGIFIWPDNKRYEGDFVNGNRNGIGIFSWPNGDHYEGDFVNDYRTGQGTYVWSNGEKYIGEWKENKQSGKGTLYNGDGSIKTQGKSMDGNIVHSVLDDTEYVFKNLFKNPQAFAEKHLRYGKSFLEYDLWVGQYGKVGEIQLGLKNGEIKYAVIKVDDFSTYDIARPIVISYYGNPNEEGRSSWGAYQSKWALNDVLVTLAAAVVRGSSFYGESSEKSFMMFNVQPR